jgi:quercetin dioxygenase-like cupin family protein
MWAGPPSLPPGAQAAVLLGNPAKEGPFVLRLKFPADFAVPPHRHSKDELGTVIAGGLVSGPARSWIGPQNRCRQGAFVHLPAGMPHYAVANSETIVQINGTGPFDVTCVDPRTIHARSSGIAASLRVGCPPPVGAPHAAVSPFAS